VAPKKAKEEKKG